jgi:hypothetical protein
MKKDKLNPELMVGDEIMVLDNNQPKGASFNPPKLYTPYVVVGIKHKHMQKWQGPDTDTAYYQIEPVDITDDELLGGLLAGGGRRRLTHLYTNDKWTLRKGFLRGGINEHNQPGLNPELKVGDIVRVIDVDGEHARMPERFGVYKVVKVGNAPIYGVFDTYYDIVPYPEPEISDIFSLSDTLKMSPIKTLYRGDTWIYGDTPTANKVDRLTINEQGFSWDGTYANEIDEGNGADTSWSNDEEKITLQDILELTKNIEVINFPTKELSKVVLNWDDNPEEIERISQVEVSQQYPILIMVNEDNKILWVLDGNHRAQKALMNNIDSIPAKLIKPSDLDERTIKMFFPKGIPGTNQTISEQEEPETDDYSDEEIDKRKTYDSDEENETGDGKPFTPVEVKILNTLHKYLTRSDLQRLSQEVPSPHGGIGSKFWGVMKLFGVGPGNTEEDTRTSKYAKWASDNWTEEGDYGNIENPLKVPLKWYDVDREETGSQVEYKSGNAEVLGFDEDNAGERADYDFYAWDGEMHTNDYGDYEQYDSEITRSDFIRMDESIKSQTGGIEVQDLLFNFWKKVGPTMEVDKLKLIGFDMNDTQDRKKVIMNLVEYYGDEEIIEIIRERLEGIQGWEYEYVVTNINIHDLINPNMTYPPTIMIDVVVDGSTQIPVSTEDGIEEITLWEANEIARKEWKGTPTQKELRWTGPNYLHLYNVYEEVREQVLSDISILLKNIPVEPMLDYVDFSRPDEKIDDYVGTPEVITESKINDLVWSEKPTQKHKKRMEKEFGKFEEFPIDDFMSTNPPKNDSEESMDELMLLDSLPVIEEFVDTTDDIFLHFEKYFKDKDLEFPKEELKDIVTGALPIILQLKYHYNRPRPQQLANAKGLKFHEEPLASSKTPSYPSGHSTQGRLIAKILADKFPKHKSEINKLGNEIGTGRLVAKVHYPSDDLFGKELGDALYRFIQNKEIIKEENDIIIKDNNHQYNYKDYDKFINYVVDELNIENTPTIYVEKEPSSEYTGGTYKYKGGSERIKVRSKGRSLVDILRSLAHELVHHKQKENGDFKNKEVIKNIPEVGGHIEDEANAIAGRLIKKYGKQNQDLYEQVMVDTGDMLKSDVFKFLSNRFVLTPTEYSEIKDNNGNYYRIIDIENPYESVNLSDLLEPAVEMVSYGIKSGVFEDGDIQKAIEAVTDWLSLSMNQEIDLIN